MIAAYVSVAIGGFAQTSVGFGSGLVSVSFLAAALGPGPAVRTVLALSLILNVLVVVVERSGLDFRVALGLFVPSAIVQLAASPMIRGADASALTVATGVVVLVAAAMIAAGGRIGFLTGRAGLLVAGALSGLMNLVAGLGGPAAVLYSTNEGWPPDRWRPTINAYFAMNNVCSLAILAKAPPADAWLYVLALAGGGAGALAASRIPAATVRTAALVLSAAGGVLAIRAGLVA